MTLPGFLVLDFIGLVFIDPAPNSRRRRRDVNGRGDIAEMPAGAAVYRRGGCPSLPVEFGLRPPRAGKALAPARLMGALFLYLTTTCDAEADRHFLDPDHWCGADCHRPGLRIRLFRHAGLQGAQGRGLSRRPGQFQSGHDHDRSGLGGRDLYRADHAGDRRQDHRQGTQRPPRRLRAVAHHGWANRAEHGAVAAQDGRARQIRRHHDRRHRRRHRQGGRPKAVPRCDDQDRAVDAALASDQDA